MSEHTAKYHLNKIIGYEAEINKHIDALADLGVKVMMTSGSFIVVSNGIEKFGIPLDEKHDTMFFKYGGTDVLQKNYKKL